MGEPDDRKVVQGVLVLPDALPARPSWVSVSLIDATLADAAARVLATTTFASASVGAHEIPFRLGPLPRRHGRRRWLFDASVTADPAGRLSAGDYVLGRAVEWPARGAPNEIRLMLEKVT
jgi:hypothetical protein